MPNDPIIAMAKGSSRVCGACGVCGSRTSRSAGRGVHQRRLRLGPFVPRITSMVSFRGVRSYSLWCDRLSAANIRSLAQPPRAAASEVPAAPISPEALECACAYEGAYAHSHLFDEREWREVRVMNAMRCGYFVVTGVELLSGAETLRLHLLRLCAPMSRGGDLSRACRGRRTAGSRRSRRVSSAHGWS